MAMLRSLDDFLLARMCSPTNFDAVSENLTVPVWLIEEKQITVRSPRKDKSSGAPDSAREKLYARSAQAEAPCKSQSRG